jgi:hypothetical protein
MVSKMDQRSIVLYFHLKWLSAHVIYDDLVATLGPKAVAYHRITRYLCEAKLGTAAVTLKPEPSSPHLDDSDRTVLAALEERKSRFRPCENLRESSMSPELVSIEGSQNRFGSYDVFFARCRTFR